MAALSGLESLLSSLPSNVRLPMLAYTREWARSLRFGAPSTVAVRAENLGGALVPFTTSSTIAGEVAVAHMLARVPRMAIPVLHVGQVDASIPALTVTRAADASFVYVSSPETSVPCWLYIE